MNPIDKPGHRWQERTLKHVEVFVSCWKATEDVWTLIHVEEDYGFTGI